MAGLGTISETVCGAQVENLSRLLSREVNLTT